MEVGSTYQSSSSTWYAENEITLTDKSKWCRVSFESSSQAYYTDENGDVAGPVDVAYITDGLPSSLSTDGASVPYYYYVSKSFETSGRPNVNGNIVLILADGVEVNLNSGINVVDRNSLTITTGGLTQDYEGTGSLTAQGGEDQSAIGSSRNYSGGNITINAGKVTATGGKYGAGIGGSYNGAGGTITINGGNITTLGSQYAAGIGGGYAGAAGTITINGGTINATCNDSGAGIGSGYYGAAGTITINGGTIEAACNKYGAAIGGGYNSDGGIITINGGTVIAKGATAGIGAGFYKTGGTLTINGDSAVVISAGLKSLLLESATATAVGEDYYAFCTPEESPAVIGKSLDLLSEPNLQNVDSAVIYFAPSGIDVTIGKSSYATLYYSKYNLEVPADVTASTYYVNDELKEGSVTWSEGEVIPAGTAVVLTDNNTTESITYTFQVSNDGGKSAVDGESMLYGFDEDNTTVGPDENTEYKFYMVSTKNGEEAGFYWGADEGGAFTSEAHKAYLAVPKSSNAKDAYLFNEIPTGIDDVNIADLQFESTRIYDLNGRYMGDDAARLKKGVYIRSGKKIVVK